MVDRAASEAFRSDAPALEQRREAVVLDHFREPAVMPREPFGSVTHLQHGLEYILFHVGTGVFLRAEDLQNGRILVPVG